MTIRKVPVVGVAEAGVWAGSGVSLTNEHMDRAMAALGDKYCWRTDQSLADLDQATLIEILEIVEATRVAPK